MHPSVREITTDMMCIFSFRTKYVYFSLLPSSCYIFIPTNILTLPIRFVRSRVFFLIFFYFSTTLPHRDVFFSHVAHVNHSSFVIDLTIKIQLLPLEGFHLWVLYAFFWFCFVRFVITLLVWLISLIVKVR